MNQPIFAGMIALGISSMMILTTVITVAYASTGPVQTGPYTKQAVDHINKAQIALQNGETEGANKHLELAKQTLEEYNRGEVKPVNPDIVITK